MFNELSKNDILITENLTKRYSSFTALENLSLGIAKNTCVGLLGPNGAGKSTTIKIMTGLLRPSLGSVIIEGYDIQSNLRNALLNVGTVVETPEFPSYLTPSEVLTYFGRLRGMSKENIISRTNKVLELVNLNDWKRKKIAKFSKGMKQRVAIAASLLHDPNLLILDEPTSGLDPRGLIEVREIIKSLKKEGKTVFLSSHLLGETQEICDSIVLIDKGKLLMYDTVENIRKLSKNPKIKIELLTSPTEEQRTIISKLNGVKSITNESDLKLIINFEGGMEERSEFLKKLQKNDFKIVSFNAESFDLESLYLDLVSESVR